MGHVDAVELATVDETDDAEVTARATSDIDSQHVAPHEDQRAIANLCPHYQHCGFLGRCWTSQFHEGRVTAHIVDCFTLLYGEFGAYCGEKRTD